MEILLVEPNAREGNKLLHFFAPNIGSATCAGVNIVERHPYGIIVVVVLHGDAGLGLCLLIAFA